MGFLGKVKRKAGNFGFAAGTARRRIPAGGLEDFMCHSVWANNDLWWDCTKNCGSEREKNDVSHFSWVT